MGCLEPERQSGDSRAGAGLRASKPSPSQHTGSARSALTVLHGAGLIIEQREAASAQHLPGAWENANTHRDAHTLRPQRQPHMVVHHKARQYCRQACSQMGRTELATVPDGLSDPQLGQLLSPGTSLKNRAHPTPAPPAPRPQPLSARRPPQALLSPPAPPAPSPSWKGRSWMVLSRWPV